MHSLARQLVASACLLGNGLIAGYTPPHFDNLEKGAPPPARTVVAQSISSALSSDSIPFASCGTAAPSPEFSTRSLEAETLVGPPPPPAEPPAEKKWKRLLDGSCKLGRTFSAVGPEPSRCLDAPTSWRVGLRMPDLPMTLQGKELDRLDKYIRWYSESAQGRKVVKSWLKRSGHHRGVVAKVLRQHDLPHDLQAVVFVESGYSPNAKSPVGAVGLWQFMPRTGRDYGLVIEADYDERRSVERSSEAAASHLSDLYGLFGNWELSLAAYSMGAKSLAKKMRDFDEEDFWRLADYEGALPKETVAYVPKIMSFAIVLKNLERFGFDDISPDPPWFTSDVEIPSGIHLGLVARSAGTSLHRIRELNPEIMADVVPGHDRDLIVHIPSSGLSRAKVMLPKLLFDPDADGLESQVSADFDWGRDELASSAAAHAPPVAVTDPKPSAKSQHSAHSPNSEPSTKPAPVVLVKSKPPTTMPTSNPGDEGHLRSAPTILGKKATSGLRIRPKEDKSPR